MTDKPAKKPRKQKPPTRQAACCMRLVNQTTPHGEFLRYGWVTYIVETNEIISFEPAPVVYADRQDARNVAAQIDAASDMGVLEIKQFGQRTH